MIEVKSEEVIEEKKEEKKKLNTLDKYVLFCLIFLVLYTVAHTVIFAITGKESKILDALVFAAFSGEVVQCYFIKKGKLKEEAKLIFGKKKENETDVGTEEWGVGDD